MMRSADPRRTHCRCQHHTTKDLERHDAAVDRLIFAYINRRLTEHNQLVAEIKDRPPWQDV